MIRSAKCSLIVSVAIVSLLTACAVGPRYHAPNDLPVIVKGADTDLVSAISPEGSWWAAFGDPELNALITRALDANLDIRQAVARVDEARAIFSASRLDFFPHITSDAGYGRSDEQIPGLAAGRINIQQADLGFDATWEVDLFGRVRHGVEAAQREAGAAQSDLASAKVSVAADVALNYLQLRGTQARREVAERNAQVAREAFKLVAIRSREGYAEPADRESARAQVAAIEALISPLDAEIAHSTQRLAVLIGERPGTLDTELARPLAIVPRVAALPIGDASTFLRRRPDVRAAEFRMAAQTARTGVATADLFPRLNVMGFIGLLTGNVSTLFNKSSQAWSVSPAISWPAFDIGSQVAQLRAQKARGRESEAAYQQVVLNAIEDLQDALTNYKQHQVQLARLLIEVDAARNAADLVRRRYDAGGSDYLRVLDAQRVQLQGEDAFVQAQTETNVGIIAIYKALGGGWT